MAFIAPNLSNVIGPSTAAKLMGNGVYVCACVCACIMMLYRCCWWSDCSFQDAFLQCSGLASDFCHSDAIVTCWSLYHRFWELRGECWLASHQ